MLRATASYRFAVSNYIKTWSNFMNLQTFYSTKWIRIHLSGFAVRVLLSLMLCFCLHTYLCWNSLSLVTVIASLPYQRFNSVSVKSKEIQVSLSIERKCISTNWLPIGEFIISVVCLLESLTNQRYGYFEANALTGSQKGWKSHHCLWFI